MSRKLVIYIATSLNSRIATKDGSVEWLDTIPHPKEEDYGYYKFYDTIDSTIMGYSTYAQVKGWDIPFPYKDKKNYVITRRNDLAEDTDVEFISNDHVNFISDLKKSSGQDIWLVGGGGVNTLLLNAGLVDKLIVHVMPIILNDGIEMLGAIPELTHLKLISSKSYSSGVVELCYSVDNKNS